MCSCVLTGFIVHLWVLKNTTGINFLKINRVLLITPRPRTQQTVLWTLQVPSGIWFCVSLLLLEHKATFCCFTYYRPNIFSPQLRLKWLPLFAVSSSLEQSPSWKADSSSASRDISLLYGIGTFSFYGSHNNLLLVFILSQINPIHVLLTHPQDPF